MVSLGREDAGVHASPLGPARLVRLASSVLTDSHLMGMRNTSSMGVTSLQHLHREWISSGNEPSLCMLRTTFLRGKATGSHDES
jgi:hypothetical protein